MTFLFYLYFLQFYHLPFIHIVVEWGPWKHHQLLFYLRMGISDGNPKNYLFSAVVTLKGLGYLLDFGKIL